MDEVKHGGSRKGAGRKLGSKGKAPKGRTVTTSSINLPPATWQRLDALRGDLSRSKYIDAMIKSKRVSLK